MNNDYDVVVRVRFLTTQEGGRRTNLSGAVVPFYACPMIVDGQYFDCRIYIDGKVIALGEQYDLKAKFLSSEIVIPKLYIGKEISIWEGKIVGKGEVLEITNRN